MNDIVYSESKLEKIKELASIFLPVDDIAVAIDVPVEVLKRDIRRDTDAAKAYRQGKVSAKIEMFSREMELAKSGSPLGMESIVKHLAEMDEKELI